VSVSLHSAIIGFVYVVLSTQRERERLDSLEVNIIIYADGPSGIELGTLLSLPLPLLLTPFFYTTQGRHHVLPKARINRSNPVCLSSPSPRKFFSTEPAMPWASSRSRLESCGTGWMTAVGRSRELHPRLAQMSQHCHVSDIQFPISFILTEDSTEISTAWCTFSKFVLCILFIC
jgi:hypothetical protein